MKVVVDVEGKEYIIGTDAAYNSFMIYVETKDKKGELNKDSKGYFLTLPGAFNYLLSLKIKKSVATTLEELKEAIEKAKAELTAIYNTEIEK